MLSARREKPYTKTAHFPSTDLHTLVNMESSTAAWRQKVSIYRTSRRAKTAYAIRQDPPPAEVQYTDKLHMSPSRLALEQRTECLPIQLPFTMKTICSANVCEDTNALCVTFPGLRTTSDVPSRKHETRPLFPCHQICVERSTRGTPYVITKRNTSIRKCAALLVFCTNNILQDVAAARKSVPESSLARRAPPRRCGPLPPDPRGGCRCQTQACAATPDPCKVCQYERLIRRVHVAFCFPSDRVPMVEK